MVDLSTIVLGIASAAWVAVNGAILGFFSRLALKPPRDANTLLTLSCVLFFFLIPLTNWLNLFPLSLFLLPVLATSFTWGFTASKNDLSKVKTTLCEHDSTFQLKGEYFYGILVLAVTISMFLMTGYNLGGTQGALYAFVGLVLTTVFLYLAFLFGGLQKETGRETGNG